MKRNSTFETRIKALLATFVVPLSARKELDDLARDYRMQTGEGQYGRIQNAVISAALTEILYALLVDLSGIAPAEVEALIEYDNRHAKQISKAVTSVVENVLANADKTAKEATGRSVSAAEIREYLDQYLECDEVFVADGKDRHPLRLGIHSSWPVDWTMVSDLQSMLDEMVDLQPLLFSLEGHRYQVVRLVNGLVPTLIIEAV